VTTADTEESSRIQFSPQGLIPAWQRADRFERSVVQADGWVILMAVARNHLSFATWTNRNRSQKQFRMSLKLLPPQEIDD
jgi:hypothetical protein